MFSSSVSSSSSFTFDATDESSSKWRIFFEKRCLCEMLEKRDDSAGEGMMELLLKLVLSLLLLSEYKYTITFSSSLRFTKSIIK